VETTTIIKRQASPHFTLELITLSAPRCSILSPLPVPTRPGMAQIDENQEDSPEKLRSWPV
jgi:hypothetical protein